MKSQEHWLRYLVAEEPHHDAALGAYRVSEGKKEQFQSLMAKSTRILQPIPTRTDQRSDKVSESSTCVTSFQTYDESWTWRVNRQHTGSSSLCLFVSIGNKAMITGNKRDNSQGQLDIGFNQFTVISKDPGIWGRRGRRGHDWSSWTITADVVVSASSVIIIKYKASLSSWIK
jgi:hypothetical protein